MPIGLLARESVVQTDDPVRVVQPLGKGPGQRLLKWPSLGFLAAPWRENPRDIPQGLSASARKGFTCQIRAGRSEYGPSVLVFLFYPPSAQCLILPPAPTKSWGFARRSKGQVGLRHACWAPQIVRPGARTYLLYSKPSLALEGEPPENAVRSSPLMSLCITHGCCVHARPRRVLGTAPSASSNISTAKTRRESKKAVLLPRTPA